MRVLQVSTLEMPYRAWFSIRSPALVAAPHAVQIAALRADGATAAGGLADTLIRKGHAVFLCFVNDGVSQSTWARENNLSTGEMSDPDAILRRQIAVFAPDILCLDAGLAKLAPIARGAAPAAILAARVYSGDGTTDLSRFDVILGDQPAAVAALQIHRRPVHVVRPDLPANTSGDTAATVDVLARAELRPTNRQAIAHLMALAKAPLGFAGEFSLALHLHSQDLGALPIGLTMYDRGPLYGAAFRAAAAQARVVVDLDDGQEHRAHRLMEAIASGACVLAEDSGVRNFVPGLATFTTPEELVDKVYGLLRDDGARDVYRRKIYAACAAHTDDAATVFEHLAAG